MKKILFLICSFFALSSGYAQLNKRDMMIGGNLGFSSNVSGNVSTNNFNLSPDIGYFIINRVAVGMDLSYRKSNEWFGSNSSLALGPFVRGYIKLGAAALFGFAKYGYSTSLNKNNNYSNSYVAFGPGLAAFISNDVALEAIFSYNKNLENKSYDVMFNIGLQVYLVRHKS